MKLNANTTKKLNVKGFKLRKQHLKPNKMLRGRQKKSGKLKKQNVTELKKKKSRIKSKRNSELNTEKKNVSVNKNWPLNELQKQSESTKEKFKK